MFDLQNYPELSPWQRRTIETLGRPCILYRFFHCRSGRRIIHGHILTESGSRNHELIHVWCSGPTYKSWQVLDWVKDYISNPKKEKDEKQ